MATTIVTAPSPQYMYIVHVCDAMGHMTTMVADETYRLIFTHKIGSTRR